MLQTYQGHFREEVRFFADNREVFQRVSPGMRLYSGRKKAFLLKTGKSRSIQDLSFPGELLFVRIKKRLERNGLVLLSS